MRSAASPQDKFCRKRASRAIQYTLVTHRMRFFLTIL